MATAITVTVYALDRNSSGYPKAMTIPGNGYTAIEKAENIGGVATYSAVRILATNQMVQTVETPAALAALSNVADS